MEEGAWHRPLSSTCQWLVGIWVEGRGVGCGEVLGLWERGTDRERIRWHGSHSPSVAKTRHLPR